MDFGVCLPNFSFGVKPSKANIVEIAQAAERLNYNSVWVSDHILVSKEKPRYGHIYEVLITLAYLAGITQRVRLGTSILVVPQRDAILAAKQIATLDDLSDGRVILGVGVGWMDDEFQNLGADFHNRGRHTNEALRLMKALWQDDDPQFEGEFYSFKNVLFGPKPVQPGGPPVWVGGASNAAFKRIELLGDGWNADDVQLEPLKEAIQQLNDIAAKRGRPVEISLRRTVDLRPAAAKAGLLDSPSSESGIKTGRWPGSSAGAFSGSLEETKAYLEQVAQAGVSHFIFQFEHASQQEHLAQMELFANQVMG